MQNGGEQVLFLVEDGDQVVVLIQVTVGGGLAVLAVAFLNPAVEGVVFEAQAFDVAVGIGVSYFGELIEQAPDIVGDGLGVFVLLLDQVAAPVVAVTVLGVAEQAVLGVVALLVVDGVAGGVVMVGTLTGLDELAQGVVLVFAVVVSFDLAVGVVAVVVRRQVFLGFLNAL